MLLIAPLAVCALIAGCGSSGRSGSGGTSDKPSTSVSLTLDYLYDGLHAPFFAALKQGYYSKAGLNVTIIQGSGSSTSIQRVASDQVQLGLADSSTLLQVLAQSKLDVVAVGVLLRHTPEGIGVLKNSGITDAAGLEGKTVAAGSGTSDLATLPAFLAASGVPQGKVNVQQATPGSTNSLLYAKKVDGSVNYVQTFAESPAPVTFLPYYQAGLNGYGTVIIANRSWLSGHAAAMKAFLRASGQGLAYTLSQGSTATSYVAAAANRPANYYAAELPLLKPYWTLPAGTAFGTMDTSTWSDMIQLFEKYAHMPSIDASTVFTNDYVG
jgi:NitT/TauT family transport system substrate-binding protein